MSGFSNGSFSLSGSSQSSGRRRGFTRRGGHYRGRRRGGCLGLFLISLVFAGGSVAGVLSLLA
ncbi:hypothetical protein [Deinococcus humi]|uniref:Putative membrane protein n=1 Tax=Deinococcus humi TaxID=662880 RepID=A0A7W8JY06_9DEIO|nr:hypothetical protein [Deinococcus humi]MBB5363744.1 putative membrane protein [Deinococcus humi]